MPHAHIPTIKRGRMTDDELRQLDDLADEGLSPGQVAQKLNRHPATINWQFVIRGHKEFTPRAAPLKPYTRAGVTVTPFCREEDAFITALRVQGMPTPKIADEAAARFGRKRSPHTILMRLKMLACEVAA